MSIFRDRKREEFLESEIRSLNALLEKAKGEQVRLSFSLSQSEARSAACQQQLADCRQAFDVATVRADANEAYKTDNMTLIGRVAHLQGEFSESLKRYTNLETDFAAFKAAVARAAVRLVKNKSKKKKRK